MQYSRFLRLVDVCKKVGKSNKTSILNNISLEFPNHGMFFLSGKNGSGKTTLLSVIGGLNRPTEGKIYVCEKSLYDQKKSFLEEYRNEFVSFIFQDNNLIERMTVLENISLSYQLQNQKPDIDEIKEKLLQVNITDVDGFLTKKISSLSGGEKQKVCIVRALVKKVRILIADEPSSSLDSESENEIYSILKKVSRDILVLVTSHDSELIEKYNDGIIKMENGKIVKSDLATEEYKEDNFTLSKSSHLSFGSCIRFAWNFLCAKKIRLFMSAIISLISFSLLGFSLTTLTADRNKTLLKTMNENGVTDVIIKDDSWYTVEGYNDVRSNSGFTDYQKDIIRSYTGQKELIYVYDGLNLSRVEKPVFDYWKTVVFEEHPSGMIVETPYSKNYKGILNGIIEVAESDLNYTGFTLDNRIQDQAKCHFPAQYGEIALTSFKANMYLEYGYKDKNGNVVQLKGIDDLIGSELDGYKVTAVYETEESIDLMRNHSSIDLYDARKKRENDLYLYGTYINNYLIMPKGSVSAAAKAQKTVFPTKPDVYYKLSKDSNEVIELAQKLTYDEPGRSEGSVIRHQVQLASPVSNVVDTLYYQTYSVSHILALVATGIFLVLNLLMVSFLISTGFNEKKKTLSVLVSLGARKKDLAYICLFESLLLSLFSLALASGVIIGVCAYLNNMFFCTYFIYDLFVFGLLLLIVLFVSLVSTLLPLLKLLTKQPIDLIKEKNE